MELPTLISSPKYLLIWLIPIIISPTIYFIPGQIGKGAFVILLMGAYWCTEVIPLAITSLLPMVLFPIFGILSTTKACEAFVNETILIFLASLMAAIAVENSNLHNRISIKVLLLFGTSPKWLLLGFMINTMLLSMWISNTATTALMLPIVDAVLVQLRHRAKSNSETNNRKVSIISNLDLSPPEVRRRSRSGSVIAAAEDPDVDAKSFNILRKSLFLAICYAANIGGIGTLTGTGPNLVFYGIYSSRTGTVANEITFANWMLFNVPTMLLCGFIAWMFVSNVYVRRATSPNHSNSQDKIVRSLIEKKNELMGDVTFHEWAVLSLFISMICLWFFRNPSFLRGWAPLMIDQEGGEYIGDATPALFIVILLFMIPAKPLQWYKSPPLLDWQTIQEKFPWNIFILIGGGFVLAKGTQTSGLSEWFSETLIKMHLLPPIVLMLILCIIALCITELTSNTATATVLLPSIIDMADKLGYNPLYFALPVTICCSFSFVLPIASATNAIVFEAGEMKTMDMVIPGIVMKIFCLIIVVLMVNSWGVFVFGFNPIQRNSTVFVSH